MNTLIEVDLTQGAPRSPRVRLLNYAILARTIDKCRASLSDTIGEYKFDSTLDNQLFGFKGVKAEAFRNYVASGRSDQEIARWFDSTGVPKTLEQVMNWSSSVEEIRPYNIPDHQDWFVEACAKVGLNPATSTLFDWLEADDAASFRK